MYGAGIAPDFTGTILWAAFGLVPLFLIFIATFFIRSKYRLPWTVMFIISGLIYFLLAYLLAIEPRARLNAPVYMPGEMPVFDIESFNAAIIAVEGLLFFFGGALWIGLRRLFKKN